MPYCLCYSASMAEEKQTPIVEEVHHDDIDVLRYVLQNVRGTTPVSVYKQADFIAETDDNE